jgi:hypothetical protein
MPKLRWMHSVIVTVLCGVWIIFLLHSRAQIMFETVSGIVLALLVVVSVWWRRINKHPALATGMAGGPGLTLRKTGCPMSRF